MKGPLNLNLAVPGRGLLKSGDDSKLAIETSSWMHLNRYVGKVENLPAEFDSGSAASSEALDKVREAVQSFGTPRQLRQLIRTHPDALADKQQPAILYAGIVWLVQRLHASAASVVSTLQSLGKHAGSSEDMKRGLQLLGNQAQDARNPIGPLIVSLKKFKTHILDANSSLSDAFEDSAGALQKAQEAVGGLKVRIESLQKKIDNLGFLSSKKKKKDLQEQLDNLQQDLGNKSAEAERLRSAFGKLEPILGEGHWLASGVDDLVDCLNTMTKVWTTFGSDVGQLAADASSDQLEDPAWMKKALGLDDAIKQWNTVDRAAKQFTEASLADFPGD